MTVPQPAHDGISPDLSLRVGVADDVVLVVFFLVVRLFDALPFVELAVL